MIRLIAAIDQQRGIARQGVQPWHIARDEQYFKEQTISHGGVVLMGRHTFKAIGHPLKDRLNVVLSHQPPKYDVGVWYANDLESFLASSKTDVWVIGGAAVFEQTLGLADELYLTKIAANFDCDKFFPDYETSFGLQYQGPEQTENDLRFYTTVYVRL